MFRDGHHIIHHEKEWTLRKPAQQIRETPQLIQKMERPLHEEIHRECPAIPLLGYHALIRTLSLFEPQETSVDTMENLMRAIESASKHPKAHEVEKSLAELAIHAIDLQRPFIAYAEAPRKLIS